MKYAIVIDDKFYIINDVNFFKKFNKEELILIYLNNLIEILYYETLKEMKKKGIINEKEINDIPINELLFTVEKLEQLIGNKKLIENKRKNLEKLYIETLKNFINAKYKNNRYNH